MCSPSWVLGGTHQESRRWLTSRWTHQNPPRQGTHTCGASSWTLVLTARTRKSATRRLNVGHEDDGQIDAKSAHWSDADRAIALAPRCQRVWSEARPRQSLPIQSVASRQMSDHSSGPSRKVWVAGLGALIGVSCLSWWLGARAQSPEQAAAKASEPDASLITAEVERRVLASTVVLRGDVKPEMSLEVAAPSSVEGAVVVTRVPPAAGSEVAEGQVVIEVSGRPVFVLQGDVPVYRTLKPGMSGADVQQLQDALTRLGFTPDVNGAFGEATKQAVSAFYAAAGFDPLPSEVTVADVSSAQQAFDQATAALTAAEDALTQAEAGGSGSAVAAAQAALNQAYRSLADAKASKVETVQNAQAALTAAQNAYNSVMADPMASQADKDAATSVLVEAQTALDVAKRNGEDAIAAASDQVYVASLQLSEAKMTGDTAAAQAARDQAAAARDNAALSYMSAVEASGPTVAQGEMVFLPTMPARVQSAVTLLGPVGGGRDGGGDQSDTSSLLTLSAGDLIVTTSIRSGDDGFVRVGMSVELLDEATNATFKATLTAVADTAAADASGQLGKPATITPDEPLPPSLDAVNLRATITASASDGEVLVVPLSAVSSSSAGVVRVSVLRDGSADPVDVPVTAGISADGFVAVEPTVPGALVVGDLVVVGDPAVSSP